MKKSIALTIAVFVVGIVGYFSLSIQMNDYIRANDYNIHSINNSIDDNSEDIMKIMGRLQKDCYDFECGEEVTYGIGMTGRVLRSIRNNEKAVYVIQPAEGDATVVSADYVY